MAAAYPAKRRLSMRHRAKIDSNQGSIVKLLRLRGFSVQSLAAVGNGVPDLLVGKHGKNSLVEIKDGSLVPSHRKLTPLQEEWHKMWEGKIHIITSEREALDFDP
jgi:hypothetical protein